MLNKPRVGDNEKEKNMDEGGEDFVVQKKRSRRTKRKNIASSDSDG